MNSVSAGSRSRVGLGEVGGVDVRDEPERRCSARVMTERLVGHARAEVGAADPDVDDVPDPPAGMPRPRAARARASANVRHPVEHLVHVRRRRRARRPRSTRPRGARSATWSTARSSVMLMRSPRNMASIRARSPHRRGASAQEAQRLVGRRGSSSSRGRRRRPRRRAARRACGSWAKSSRRWTWRSFSWCARSALPLRPRGEPGGARHGQRPVAARATCARAAAATASGVKPNFFWSSLSGAEAPNVSMPIRVPSRPT